MPAIRAWTFILIATATLTLPIAVRADQSGGARVSVTAPYGGIALFDRNTAVFPQWTDVMRRAAVEMHRELCTAGADRGCTPAEWRTLIAEISGLPLMAKLEIVNRTFNALPYVTAWQNWHRPSYWETPFEFLARGGQCEDYAIAKYLALHAAGVGDDTIRVLIVRDTDLGVDHAVLLAEVASESYLLDNLDPRIRPVALATEYRPYYAINLSGYWTYLGGRSMLAAGR